MMLTAPFDVESVIAGYDDSAFMAAIEEIVEKPVNQDNFDIAMILHRDCPRRDIDSEELEQYVMLNRGRYDPRYQEQEEQICELNGNLKTNSILGMMK